jgi:hypothetical protein
MAEYEGDMLAGVDRQPGGHRKNIKPSGFVWFG